MANSWAEQERPPEGGGPTHKSNHEDGDPTTPPHPTPEDGPFLGFLEPVGFL